MRIAVVGGGILGLTAAREFLKDGHRAVVYEKAATVGGLAGSFEIGDSRLEKYYHHIFTSDNNFIGLVQELGLEKDSWWGSPKTAVWDGSSLYPFSSPLDILRFPPLPLLDRVRLGLVSACLKAIFNPRSCKCCGGGVKTSCVESLESIAAVEWCRRWMGPRASAAVWEPLLKAKFHNDWDKVTMAWLWARIKKRSFKLGYLGGGFGGVFDKLVEEIQSGGGEVRGGEEVKGIKGRKGVKGGKGSWQISTARGT
ncbi:NAD(P)-binding protein, partial [Candidatus Parcubacteria bacterium]|nr:NAD(P)-binding protein [Candidatus Parcubacteria bacterium]